MNTREMQSKVGLIENHTDTGKECKFFTYSPQVYFMENYNSSRGLFFITEFKHGLL